MALDFKDRQGYAEGETGGDEFGYQKAISKQMRKRLRGMPGVLADAGRQADLATERQGAQVMAQTGTRDLGALTDVGAQYRQQAASQMFNRALQTEQAGLDALSAEAAMDTDVGRSDKAMQDAQDRIKTAIADSGWMGEEQAVMREIDDMLKTERDPEVRKYLTERRGNIEKASGWGAKAWNLLVPGADDIGEDV